MYGSVVYLVRKLLRYGVLVKFKHQSVETNHVIKIYENMDNLPLPKNKTTKLDFLIMEPNYFSLANCRLFPKLVD